MNEKVEIHGICDLRFERVKEAFTRNFDEDMEVGASFAVTIDGKYVIDIWGGYKDVNRTQQWEKDTICNVYSTTKVPTVLCTMMCVDRGLLDLDAPVAKYWPEFAQNGKEGVLVRHCLSHTTGLAGIDETSPPTIWYDWEKTTSLLAAQKPWWEPGTKSGYHAITHGYLLGELVRRVTGKTLGTFFKEEIAEPLGIDFHIGLPEKIVPRVSNLIPPRPLIEMVSLMLGGVFNAANESDVVKKKLSGIEQIVLFDLGDGDIFTITIKNDKIRIKKGLKGEPDLKYRVSKESAGVLYSLFSSLNFEPEYVSEHLKIEGNPEDAQKFKKLMEVVATEARKTKSVGLKMALNPIALRIRSNDREWQAAEIPAANGHGNARSVARIASIIACEGEVEGKRFISKETLEKILEEQIFGQDLVMAMQLRWGLGVGLPNKYMPFPHDRTCFWGGAGGSAITMDMDAHISIGYVMNQMRNQPIAETAQNKYHSDTRGSRLITAVFESLELI